MPDDLDRLIADLRHLDARARIGPRDEVNAQKLAYSEFGTITEPPRPTMTAAFDRTRATLTRAIDRKVAAVLDGTSHLSGRRILAGVGEDFAEVVREEIDNNTPPPLAASTLAQHRAKGQGDRSLVASGAMRDSIEVQSKDGTDGWGDGE